MEKIDKLDKQIMEIISNNARIPFKDVATACGVSRAAIHQRVQRLIDMNVIVGSGYNVNPKSLGYTTCTYVGITLEKGSLYKQVVDELKHVPEIVECHYTTGPYSMLVQEWMPQRHLSLWSRASRKKCPSPSTRTNPPQTS